MVLSGAICANTPVSLEWHRRGRTRRKRARWLWRHCPGRPMGRREGFPGWLWGASSSSIIGNLHCSRSPRTRIVRRSGWPLWIGAMFWHAAALIRWLMTWHATCFYFFH